MTIASGILHRTPLHALHLALGGKMVPFAGYSMPVSYPQGILAEHRQCRESAALFDVSHMGQLRLVGDDAAVALETRPQLRKLYEKGKVGQWNATTDLPWETEVDLEAVITGDQIAMAAGLE